MTKWLYKELPRTEWIANKEKKYISYGLEEWPISYMQRMILNKHKYIFKNNRFCLSC